ncbi:molybdenum cofactor synthesis protein [Natrialba hulunbeirensis JCM 10989]|uniref:Molybdenum cofactor synthesis protein n=1 Tax=Natrialba hulunbeirensis JCM 10989 TaxID=1227493 RepID=L9ZSK6_9EURY|nr:molybdopterin-binding protein [Natrialba hulunbeirensis]ELY89061.1 molybdenum cofactor synthesis protein [Natrialba hulunbeirensis JCM 10989]
MNESSESPSESSPADTAAESTTEVTEATETPNTLGIGLVTVADDRTLESDAAGEALMSTFTEASHEVVMREHVGRGHDTVQSIVSRVIDRDDVDVVVTAGATSIEPNDITIEAVQPLIEKPLPTFSELFTHLSYEAHGSRAVGARTIGGVTEETLIFCLPGNADAAELAATEILVPEGPHLVELARDGNDEGDEDDEGDEGNEDGPADTDETAAESNESSTTESDATAGPNGGEDV